MRHATRVAGLFVACVGLAPARSHAAVPDSVREAAAASQARPAALEPVWVLEIDADSLTLSSVRVSRNELAAGSELPFRTLLVGRRGSRRAWPPWHFVQPVRLGAEGGLDAIGPAIDSGRAAGGAGRALVVCAASRDPACDLADVCFDLDAAMLRHAAPPVPFGMTAWIACAAAGDVCVVSCGYSLVADPRSGALRVQQISLERAVFSDAMRRFAALAVAPDGQAHLVVLTYEGDLVHRPGIEVPKDAFGHLDLGPDPLHVLFDLEHEGVRATFTLDLATGNVRDVPDLPRGAWHRSPDGSHLLVVTPGEGARPDTLRLFRWEDVRHPKSLWERQASGGVPEAAVAAEGRWVAYHQGNDLRVLDRNGRLVAERIQQEPNPPQLGLVFVGRDMLLEGCGSGTSCTLSKQIRLYSLAGLGAQGGNQER